jgi:ketosteroid isomerase-like protein
MSSRPVTHDAGPREVFERLRQIVLTYDMEAQANLYAEDGVLEWPFAPPGMPRRVEGREAIRNLLVPLAERARRSGRHPEKYDPLVIHETSDPEVIVAECDLVGTSNDGEPYHLSYIQVLRVRDGEIVLFRDYWNPQALLPLLDDQEAQAG